MLEKNIVYDVLAAALSYGGDFAEIFVEDRFDTAIGMIEGKVERSIAGRTAGVGIRIFNGFNSVYTYTPRMDRDTLIHLAQNASKSLKGVPMNAKIDFIMEEAKVHHPVIIMPQSIDKSQKVNMMRRAHMAAAEYASCINQVKVNYLDFTQNVLIANSEGKFVKDQRTRTRFVVNAVAEKDGKMEYGSIGKGSGKGFELYDEIKVEDIAREAARIAVTMIDAKPAPSGKFPVVIDNKFGGVIFHEACGHGLEATSVAKNNSVFAGKLGEQIASEIVSAVDDGTVLNEWGSSSFDDEGTQTSRNILIENGVLKNYMVDKLNGRRMNMAPTGSSRRESYKFAPTSRMTNTYILNGSSRFEDMIASMDDGIYAKYLGGGSVNPTTGEFNFAAQEAYLVKNGKIQSPIKGATLIGTGLEILKKIEMVSDNFDSGEGMCGSMSGSIPAGLGQPAIKVSEITVGGKECA
ncbi:MAG: TldD/PmbA family protein [Proteocatella sp.]